MKRDSEMPCMKVYKVKLLHKLLTNYQRNLLELQKRRKLRRKLKKQRMKEETEKSKKLVEGMQKKLSEPESNVFMSKL